MVAVLSRVRPSARIPWQVSAALLGAGVVFVIVAVAFSQTAGILCFVVGGALLSAGIVACAVLWMRMLAGQPPLASLSCVALACSIAAFMSIILFSLSITWVIAAAFLLSPLASLALTVLRMRTADGADAFRREEDGPCERRESASAARAADIMDSLWPVLVGACICAVVLGLMWTGTAQGNTEEAMSAITRSIMAGFAFMSLGLSGAAMMVSDEGGFRKVLFILLPVMAVLPAVPCIVQIPPVGFVGPLFGALTGIGFAFFAAVLCWSLLREGDCVRFGGSVLLLSVGFLAAALAGPVLSGQGTIIVSLLLFVCYIAALAVASFSHVLFSRASAMQPGSESPGSADCVAASRDAIALRCEQLRNECGLSPRECEVLELLAHGRTSTYIANDLYVSNETVKVHIKHIYEKLGVHSRSALLDLFD